MKSIEDSVRKRKSYAAYLELVAEAKRQGKVVRAAGSMFSPFNTGAAGSGLADIHMANEGSVYNPILSRDAFELPLTKIEKHMWYRSFYKTDPLIGRAIDTHSTVPLSKITLTLPKGKDDSQNRKVYHFFTEMFDRLSIQRKLRNIAHEYWMFGNVFIWVERDENPAKKTWSNIMTLNPDFVELRTVPYSKNVKIELLPDPAYLGMSESGNIRPEDLIELQEGVPDEIKEHLDSKEPIILDTDPKEGSYLYHMTSRRSEYADAGTSILERSLKTILYRDKLRQAQTQIASRNMTPKRIITAPGVDDPTLEGLRLQVDSSLVDPDFSILTNYELTWTEMGSKERLLDILGEMEYTENLILIGMGLPRGILTGEGTYTGERISLEVMNTVYQDFREELRLFIVDGLFKPIALEQDFWGVDEWGHKILLVPDVKFSRNSLRDMSDMFGDLFNLYGKNAVSVRALHEILNIDSEDVRQRVEEDLFTVLDPNFNEFIRNIYNAAADKFVENTDIMKRLAKSAGVKYTPKPEETEGAGGGPGGLGGGPPELGGGMGGPPEGEIGGPPGGEQPGELGPEMGGQPELAPGELPPGAPARTPLTQESFPEAKPPARILPPPARTPLVLQNKPSPEPIKKKKAPIRAPLIRGK